MAARRTGSVLSVDRFLRRVGGASKALGWFLVCISQPPPRVLVLSNPLDRVAFRNKALDCFRFAIGPQNIDTPAKSGIFPSHESWSLLEHPSNMRLWCPGSSQLSCHNQTSHTGHDAR